MLYFELMGRVDDAHNVEICCTCPILPQIGKTFLFNFIALELFLFHVCLNPVYKRVDLSVNSGIVFVSTSITPGDDSNLSTILDEHWTTRVTLYKMESERDFDQI